MSRDRPMLCKPNIWSFLSERERVQRRVAAQPFCHQVDKQPDLVG